MITLTSPQITVSILDPGVDTARLGSRYCTGGWIWQVNDAQGRDLFSGPEYPKEPNTFDGQGAPDMFFTPLGPDAPLGEEVGVIGVGRVRRTSPKEPFYVFDNREVIEFVQWETEQGGDFVTMRTETAFKGWAYRLERAIRLEGSTIISRTAIESTGADTLPIRWFAHPFWPHTRDGVLSKFSVPVSMPENPGYYVNEDGWVTRRPEHDWKQGWYQPLEVQQGGFRLAVTQKHPVCGEVRVETNFFPDFLPIWANDRTYSFEPYYIRQLDSDEYTSWEIRYSF